MGWIIFGVLLGIIGVIAVFVINAMANDGRPADQRYKVSKPGAIAAFFIPVVLFTLIASAVQVGTGQIAVMTRFGRVTGQEMGEGFHLKNPLDKANKYDIKVLKEEADAAAASKDLQDVNGKVVVNYRLEAGKISEIHRTVGPLYKEKLVDPAIQEVFKGATAKFDATQLITDRPAVKAEAYEALKNRLERYGIIVQDLSITNFAFSTEFTKAIEAKQVAQQQSEQAKFLVEKAKQEANAAIEAARGQAEAQRLLRENATPEVLQKMAIDKWNGVLPLYVGQGSIFNIPLNR